MTTPIKDNEHIRADQKAFIDAFRRARKKLGSMDGVVGVGLGHKETGGEFTDDVAIHVFVREKKPENTLPPDQRIPPTFEGYRTDVRRVLHAVPSVCDNTAQYATIQGGIQIVAIGSNPPAQLHGGTLGCIVKKRGNNARDNVYLLTCAHVLDANGAKAKDTVYHPVAPKAGVTTKALGQIERMPKPRNVKKWVPSKTDWFDVFIDCGIARINLDSECCGHTCGQNRIACDTAVIDLKKSTSVNSPPGDPNTNPNRITDVRDLLAEDIDALVNANLHVFKVGRTTGMTEGVVRGVLSSAYSQRRAGEPAEMHDGLIEIEFVQPPNTLPGNCKGQFAFADFGDSGALVVDGQNHAVGMYYASVEHPPGAIKWNALACHIVPVLDELDVYIPTTTGTQHGSEGAADGSGAATYPPGVELPETEGQTLFAALGVEGTRPSRAPAVVTMLSPASDEQREHMRSLRDAFCETQRGRALLAVFSEVHREIGYLVRNSRPVKVAWHRHRGPAFLAQMLNYVRGDAATMPREIGGVTRGTLFARMADVLNAHGSRALREAIERHREALMLLADAETMDECNEVLRRAESAGVPA